jgi:hypothetical protein
MYRIALTNCGRVGLMIAMGLFSSSSRAAAEDRINAAVPLPKAVQVAKAEFLDHAGSESERAQLGVSQRKLVAGA